MSLPAGLRKTGVDLASPSPVRLPPPRPSARELDDSLDVLELLDDV